MHRICIWTCIAAILVSLPASAQEMRQKRAQIELVPDAASDAVLVSARLDRYPDGRREFRASLPVPSGIVSEAFQFEVNPSRGTYRLMRVQADQIATPESGDLAPRSGCIGDLPEPGCGCPNECSGSVIAYVQTLDPVFIQLTKTTATGNWTRYEDQMSQTCKWTGSGNGYCSAANPSSAGTHWFASGCARSGPHISYNHWDETVSGSYFNWDFLNDNLATYVNQSVTVVFDGLLTVSFTHTDYGEANALIFGTVSYAAANNC